MIPAAAATILKWLSAIPSLIRIGRKTHAAITEPDEQEVHPDAWSYKTNEHVRGQINSATSHKVKPPDVPQKAEASFSKRQLDDNPYTTVEVKTRKDS